MARDLMDYIDKLDPNNQRTSRLRSFIDKTRHINSEISALDAKRRAGTLDKQETFLLASDLFQLGRVVEAAQLVRPLIDECDTIDELRALQTIVSAARLDADAERVIIKILQKEPTASADPWLDLAKIQRKTGRAEQATRSFASALQINRQRTIERTLREPELEEIATPFLQRR